MAKKRTDYPAFSSGTQAAAWMEHNCDQCIKAQRPVVKHKMVVGYSNKGRCKVNEEITIAWVGTGTVTQRVSKIVQAPVCPFLRTEWPRRGKGDKDKNYPKLFEDGGL